VGKYIYIIVSRAKFGRNNLYFLNSDITLDYIERRAGQNPPGVVAPIEEEEEYIERQGSYFR
jgi:hypothetical protein